MKWLGLVIASIGLVAVVLLVEQRQLFGQRAATSNFRPQIRETGDGPKPEFVPNQLIVKYKNDPKILSQFGVRRAETISTRMNNLELNPGVNLDEAIAAYKADPEVEFVERNYILYKTDWLPNDAYFKPANINNPLDYYQWNMARINMPAAWGISQGGTNSVIVAVIDTGVAFEGFTENGVTFAKAPELSHLTFVAPRRWRQFGAGCAPLTTPFQDSHPVDDQGHGTHVTGTIAQAANNGQHAVGMAFNVKIMPLKVLEEVDGQECGGTSVAIASAIDWATTNGAKVINLSLGMSSYSQTIRDAVIRANNAGVVVVAATGNSGGRTFSPPIGYPAGFPEAIAVGASRFDNMRAEYSQYEKASFLGGSDPLMRFTNRGVDVLAPGGQIITDDGMDILDGNGDRLGDGIIQQTIIHGTPNQFTSIQNNNFDWWCVDATGNLTVNACGQYQGTSMATPHVAGLAALLISAKPSITLTEVKSAIKQTARTTVIPGYNALEHGSGLIDAYAALQSVVGIAGRNGDFNNDGLITISDVADIVGKFTTAEVTLQSGWDIYDLDYDGKLKIGDVALELEKYVAISNPVQ